MRYRYGPTIFAANSGPSTLSGDAALSAASTLVAGGTITIDGSASLSAASSMVAAPTVPIAEGEAFLSTATSLVADGLRLAVGDAALASVSSLFGTAIATEVTGASGLASAASLAANGDVFPPSGYTYATANVGILPTPSLGATAYAMANLGPANLQLVLARNVYGWGIPTREGAYAVTVQGATDGHVYAFTRVTGGALIDRSDFTSWALNGNSTLISGGTEVRTTAAATGQKGSIVCPTAVPSGWATIELTWTAYSTGDGYEGYAGLVWDSAVYGTNQIDRVNYSSSVRLYKIPSTDQAELWHASSGGFTANVIGTPTGIVGAPGGPQNFKLVWTRTGANTADVVYTRPDNATYSGSGSWVPTTAYVGVAGYTGGLFGNEQIVTAARLLVY